MMEQGMKTVARVKRTLREDGKDENAGGEETTVDESG